MKEEELYFIAIIPPENICLPIKEYQKIMSEKFDSHKAFRHVPHITLVPPFKINEGMESVLKDYVNLFNNKLLPFYIELDGFSHFKKHTLFVEVKKNNFIFSAQSELLNSLNQKKDLIHKKISYFQKFRPHITIAYKDLEPTKFRDAWSYFSKMNVNEEFECKAVSLYKYKKGWRMLNLNN